MLYLNLWISQIILKMKISPFQLLIFRRKEVLLHLNLALFGRQEIRVNFEIREVVVGGIIRPEDIASANTVNYDQMAEARIAYGGRGQLNDLQQMRYGAEVLQILMPF